MQHLTCWVGLDDSTKENGCLYYIPKSHNWGLLDKPDLAGNMEVLNDFLTPEQKDEYGNKVAIEMSKGYASFHHPLMAHGSYENFSDMSRRAFLINTFTDGTRSDLDEPLLKGVDLIPKGSKMQGQFFPLLFDPEVLCTIRC